MTDTAEIYFDEIIRETDGAYLLQIDDEQQWVPKSLATITERGIMEIPQWFAEKEGLV